ncbi:predicted protein [Chaetomium globosum CBS 148.51]|uniref:Uncharacterized protein n=1 Tax=Chaetomium globosum (strain ATCC 6205 / CBS 148.51 / DSM 1962 / NBRC 6347 / NRRL 1970) TaxID=306901 RepID=Q2GWR4_CHAGB|nr:uncharacterized protein CHGG_07590 [Chaetomium globosum CBS 148.51]EAQ86337.1 predicted protein [Chaetomium globosum CBS 148.51]
MGKIDPYQERNLVIITNWTDALHVVITLGTGPMDWSQWANPPTTNTMPTFSPTSRST